MIGRLLLRGMLVGLLAGLLAVGFGRVFGEPSVERAIAFEEASAGAPHQHGDEPSAHSHSAPEGHQGTVISRQTQSGIGLLTAGLLYGAGLGGFFALAFVFAYGRVGALSIQATSTFVAASAFCTVALVPMLKYPPNPPAVGMAETIGLRTALFFILIVLSVAAAIAATVVSRIVVVRSGGWAGWTTGAAVFVALVAIVMAALPSINEVPDSFPATTLWSFRVASLGMQAIVWSTLGLVFGWLAEQLLAPTRGPRLTVQI